MLPFCRRNPIRPATRLNATALQPASGEGDDADDERWKLRETVLSPAEPEQRATTGHASRGEDLRLGGCESRIYFHKGSMMPGTRCTGRYS